MEVQPNHHVRKLALIGQAENDGQFRVVWESESPIDPKPWLGLEDANLPFQELVQEAMERFNVEAAESMKRYLQNNIYFDITHPGTWGAAALECAVRVLGADHLLFGGSYPVRREWLIKGVEDIRSLDIDQADKELILGGNAARLFNIKL